MPIARRPDKSIRRGLSAIPRRIGRRHAGPRAGEAESGSGAPALTSSSVASDDQVTVDLLRRRAHLNARVAELQFDLGGLVYEMAIRDQIRVDVLVRRAAQLQEADAELGEVERIVRLEQTSTAGECTSCGAPHSSGATYCWQCGQPILQQIPSDSIAAP